MAKRRKRRRNNRKGGLIKGLLTLITIVVVMVAVGYTLNRVVTNKVQSVTGSVFNEIIEEM